MSTRAAAAPMRIALVNAAHDQEAGARLATRLRASLAIEPAVTPIPAGDLARALENALEPPRSSTADLRAAGERLALAQEALAQFDYPGTLAHLDGAEQRLLSTWPSETTSHMLADVALERGRVHLRQGQRERALRSFLLVHRLDPGRRLDPLRYPPEVIEVYDQAGSQHARLAPSVPLEVTGLWDGAAVYLDGRLIGSTPLTVSITPDIHHVTGTFAGRTLGGQTIVAEPARGGITVKLRFGAVTVDDRARHWRQRLVNEAPLPLVPDTAAALGRGAADFTGAEAALVIADDARGRLHLSRYDARARETTPWEPATPEVIARALQPPDDVAALLADRTFSGTLGPEGDDRPWYRRPVYKGLVNTGIALSVAAIVFYAVLEPPPTVNGRCCTISAGSIPGSLGLSF